jgi:hypothetical protein
MSITLSPEKFVFAPAAIDSTPPQKRAGVNLLLITAACAIGILVQAYVGYRGRVTGNTPAMLYWGSLVVMYGTTAAVLLGRKTSRTESALSVLVLAVSMQVTRLVLYPDMFVYHDELIHVRVLQDIISSNNLFTSNSILPVTPHYPGLEVASAGVHGVTGLSAHASGSVVLILARMIMSLGLFLIVERIASSSRVAAIAVLIYIANPQFLFFNSQFSYQTLALPLCFAFVYLISMFENTRRAIAWPCLAAVAVATASTHHLTSVALLLLLVSWCAVATIVGTRPRQLFFAACLLAVTIVAWGFAARSLVFPYFSGIAEHNIESIGQLIRGHSDHKFFKDTAGDRTPVWERYASLASVLMIMAMLVPALWRGRSWFTRRKASAMILCFIAALYPIIPMGHLTNATSEVADRSSGFLFVGVGFVLAWWAFGEGRILTRSNPSLENSSKLLWAAATAAAVVIFVGGTVVGSGPPWLRAPGDFLVSADNRSVDSTSLSAAQWLAADIPPEQRVYSDRTNSLLANAVGDQHPLTSLADGIANGDMSRLLLAPGAPSDVATAKRERLQLLIVDSRLASELPHVGVYTDNGEFGGEGRLLPPSPATMTKFDSVPGTGRIYDNGSIRIYDVSASR